MRITKKKNEVMKKFLLFLAMVTVSVATWAQENGIYRAIEGEEFQEYISKLTKCLFGDRLLLWDDVDDEAQDRLFYSGPVTRETVYYDSKNGLIVKVIRKPSDEVEKDFCSDLKRFKPCAILASPLDKGEIREKSKNEWKKMVGFEYMKVEDNAYDLQLYGSTKNKEEFLLFYNKL